MKLIKEFTSITDAEIFAGELRRKGILTHISGINAKQLGAFATGTTEVGVWVVLSEQEQDALHLTLDKNHVVQHALSEDEMDDLEHNAKSQMTGLVNLLAVSLVAFVLMLIVLSEISTR